MRTGRERKKSSAQYFSNANFFPQRTEQSLHSTGCHFPTLAFLEPGEITSVSHILQSPSPLITNLMPPAPASLAESLSQHSHSFDAIYVKIKAHHFSSGRELSIGHVYDIEHIIGDAEFSSDGDFNKVNMVTLEEA